MSSRSHASSNPVSAIGTRILKVRDQRLALRNSLDTAQNRESIAAETRQRRANSRECRGYFFKLDTAHRDPTGWLGREDSNLRMAESKSAALPLGYAPSRGSFAAMAGGT